MPPIDEHQKTAWHGFTSLLDYGKAMLQFTVMLVGTMYAGMTFMLDKRYAPSNTHYVMASDLDSAVQKIQKGLVNDRISTLETQIQVVHRKLDGTADAETRKQLEDELRVLLDAKAKAERDRQEILQQLGGA